MIGEPEDDTAEDAIEGTEAVAQVAATAPAEPKRVVPPEEAAAKEMPGDWRPTSGDLMINQISDRAARSDSTIRRAIASGQLRAKKWRGLIFCHIDDIDAIYSPNELQRRRDRANPPVVNLITDRPNNDGWKFAK